MKLSVVCPALLSRYGASPILDDLRAQIDGKSAELIVLTDNASMSVGEKCNHLYGMASGDYISCVADDDFVAADYVDSLLGALGHCDPDVFTFNVDWQAGEPFMDWPVSSCELRPMAAVRAPVAKRFAFPDWSQSEDLAFRVWLQVQYPTVEHIDKILYRYNFRQSKPEYGGEMYQPGGHVASQVDVARVVEAQCS